MFLGKIRNPIYERLDFVIESEADSKRLDLAVEFLPNEFVNEVQYSTPPDQEVPPARSRRSSAEEPRPDRR